MVKPISLMKDNTYDNPLFAKFYDFIVERIGLKGLESDFWKSCAKLFGGPILEMGCGTGRILLPLAEMGYSVTGIDISLQMLKILEQKLKFYPPEVRKRVQYIKGNMADSLVTKRKYSLIIFCGSQFMHLETDEQRLDCLNNCRNLLAKDGVIVISNNKLDKGIQRRFETKSEKTGDRWKLQTRRTWKKGIFQDYFKLVPKFKNQKEHLFCWSLYPIKDTYMKHLIRQAGLQNISHPSGISIRKGTNVYISIKRT